jgi:DNA-binding NarL/FixJ family response regulator
MAKVLVLEDNPEMLATILDILTDYCDHSDTQEDLELTGFPTPEEALEWARWNNFDLMITDVRMAGFADGIGTLTEIKKIRPKIYSIVITGFTDDTAPARAMKTGAEYFLYKPVQYQKLLNTVEQVLQTQREHTTYQSVLKGIFKSSARFLQSLTGKQVEQELTLDDARLNCYKAFYTGLQSKNVTIGAALNLWDILLRLELTYDSMAKIFGPEAEQQKAYYERLQRMAEEFATSRDVGRLGPRRPPQISKPYFPNFYHQVQEAAVSLPAIIGAPLFWHYHASRGQLPTGKAAIVFKQLFQTDPHASKKTQVKEMKFSELLKILEATA